MSWLQFLLPLALLLAPVIGQLVKKAKELHEANQAEQTQARLRAESLRTGRGSVETASTATARTPVAQAQGGAAARSNLEEIARRRQAELQELRRRQMAARGQSAPQPQAPTQQAPARVRLQSTSQAPPRRPVAQPVPQRTAQPRQSPARQQRTRPQPDQPARRRLSKTNPAEAKQENRLGTRQLGRLASLEPQEVPREPVARPVQVPTSMEGWRQAIVVSEILARPVSMRSGHL